MIIVGDLLLTIITSTWRPPSSTTRARPTPPSSSTARRLSSGQSGAIYPFLGLFLLSTEPYGQYAVVDLFNVCCWRNHSKEHRKKIT